MNNRRPENSLSTGQFGRLNQLARKALRLYDDRGVLSPAWTDPVSRYRHYRHDHLTVARRVCLLREMEMPLEQITPVIKAWEDDPIAATRLVRDHVASVQKKLKTIQLAARLLMNELSRKKEQIMAFQSDKREMAKQNVVSIRKRITMPSYHEWIMPAFRQLWGQIEASGARVTGDTLTLYY